jgi:hypothetical protein
MVSCVKSVTHTKKLYVVRYSCIQRQWYICSALTYENAIRSPRNGFKLREDALKYAESIGLQTVFQPKDKLQHDRQ